jgi:hypothetical protein
MTQMRAGITKTFQGLRTGDQRTLFTGVALVIFSVWRRGRGTRELVYRRVLREDEALMIKTGTRSGSRVVVSADLADQVKSLARNRASAKPQ